MSLHWLDCAKSPVIEIEPITASRSPEFARVSAIASLLPPTASEPNCSDGVEVDKEILDCATLLVKSTTWLPFDEGKEFARNANPSAPQRNRSAGTSPERETKGTDVV